MNSTQTERDIWRISLLQFMETDFDIYIQLKQSNLLSNINSPYKLTLDDFRNAASSSPSSSSSSPSSSSSSPSSSSSSPSSSSIIVSPRLYGVSPAAGIELLKKYYTYRTLLFIQDCLSNILMYPEKFLGLKKYANNLMKDYDISGFLDEMDKFGYISNPETDRIILSIIRYLGEFAEGEDMEKSLLNKLILNPWAGLGDEILDSNLKNSFHSIIQTLQGEGVYFEFTSISSIYNEFVKIFSRNDGSPSVIDFLNKNLVKIDYTFKNSTPTNSQQDYFNEAYYFVQNYLKGTLSDTIYGNLKNLLVFPSNNGVLNLFRRLRTNNGSISSINEYAGFHLLCYWTQTSRNALVNLYQYIPDPEGLKPQGDDVRPANIFPGTLTDPGVLKVPSIFNNYFQSKDELYNNLATPAGFRNVATKIFGGRGL